MLSRKETFIFFSFELTVFESIRTLHVIDFVLLLYLYWMLCLQAALISVDVALYLRPFPSFVSLIPVSLEWFICTCAFWFNTSVCGAEMWIICRLFFFLLFFGDETQNVLCSTAPVVQSFPASFCSFAALLLLAENSLIIDCYALFRSHYQL